MTRLRIEHETHYRYSRPLQFGRHRLVLRPREGHDLRVEEMRLDIRPAHRLVWSRDIFGNSVALVDFTEEGTELSIVSHVVVFRTTPFPHEEPHEPWRVAYPVGYDPLELPVIAAYQAASFPENASELGEWLSSNLAAREAHDAENLIYALGSLIHDRINYQRRSTKGVQSPAETLQLATGSCRDMATLMMDAGRILGFATRFASGYLDCAASEAGRASTHAWTEFYLPALGWRGFDPTLGEPTSLKHVVTGVSNHPRGVMPVSGIFTGCSYDCLEMIVRVKTEQLAGE